jgi:hypothetical protein
MDKDGIFWFVSRCKGHEEAPEYAYLPPCGIKQVVLTHQKVADYGVIGTCSKELSSDLPRV